MKKISLSRNAAWGVGLVMLCLAGLTACGGGGAGSSAVSPPDASAVTPPGGNANPPPAEILPTGPVNATGPGAFKEASLLKLVSAADVAFALQAAGDRAFIATPRYAVRAYRMSYLTVDGTGKQILASALVAVPQKAANAASPVLSYQHGTVSKESQAPSNLADPGGPEIVMASLGYIVVSADYVGYGLSKGIPHPYVLSAPSAAVVIDMLTAARYWRQTQGVPDNKQLFMAGYSEGGYVTMAAHRALQLGSSSLRSELVAVVPGAGPYDVGLTLDEGLALVRKAYPLLASFLRPGLLKYLSEADRNNVRNFLLKQAFGGEADVSFMPTALDYYLADDKASLDTYSNVFNWRPEVPVHLFHGRDDQTVSFLNSSSTLQTMQAQGAGRLVTLTECQAQPAGHSQCVLPYWRFMLDTFAQAAKDL